MKNEIKTAGEILRQTAEELLKSKSSKSTTQLSKIETQKLIHELEVHQIELELQNEELLLASIESKKAAEKFSDLYDFAPSGYFTLSKNGEIIELNLCGAQMLGKERVYLINRRFGFFVSDDTKPIFNLFLDQAFKSRVKESCEISIVIDRQILIYVHLSGIVSENGEHCLVNVIDITESKRTEEALKASEELYRNLIEKMPDGVYKSTHDGKFVSVNPAMVAMLGYDSIEELMAIDIKKELYFEKEDRNRLVAEEEKNGFAVFKLKRKDGSGIWVEDNPWYSTDEKGNILYHEGIIRDVTERKRAELELREKEFQYRSLVNSGKALIWTTGTDKLCNYFNEPWLKFTGRTLDQEMGNGWTEGVHRDDFDRCLETYNTAFDKREEFEMEYRMHHVSGEYRWILDIGTPNYNSNGEFIGYIGHSFDITDRKLAEEALAWEQYLMNALMNNLPDHIYFKDKESRFIKINDAQAQLFGLSVPGEGIGKTDFDFFTEEHARQAYEDEQAIILSGKPLIKEEKETWTDRPDTWVSTIKLPLVNMEGNIIGTFGISRDITEKKQAEKELNESREDFIDLFDNAPVGYHELDAEGRFVRINQTELNMLGFTSEELIGQYIWKIAHNKSQTQREVKNKLKGENFYLSSFETVLVSRNGLKYSILILDKILRDDKGNVTGIRSIIQDITERKQAEESLAREQYLMNALMNNLPDHIYFKDKESRFIKINHAHAQLFGLSVPGEEIGKTDFDFFTEEHAQQAYEDEQAIILSGKPLIKEERETWTDRPDTWVSTIKLPLVNQEGNIIGTFGISRDITERKNAEVALTESEEKLSTLFASMTEMVVLNELVFNELGEAINYRIIDCNNAFTVNTGIKKEDAVGKLASDIYQTDTPPNLEIYAKVGITGEPYEFTNYYAPMDKYFMVSVISPKKNQFSTIATDITAIQQIQEEIKDKNKELENYLYVASHDLRSPLVNIQGFSQRFKKQSDAIKNALAESQQKAETKQSLDRITNEDIPKTLNFILSNVSKMDSLINGLLQISRTGRVAMIIRKVDMNHLMKTIIAGYNFQITEFSAKVIIEDLSDCYGDENQLNQLFSNIISNALKYRDSSRKLVIEIASRVQFNKVIYSVKDTGIGIGSRHLEKIWNVFYRVDSASREVGEGIGLSIAKRIIDKHKGKIWAESEEGKGSIFYIELQKNQFEE
ncbi:MAG TPA: PAS domain-containing sensor histidine kinase [Paludibacter sp.]